MTEEKDLRPGTLDLRAALGVLAVAALGCGLAWFEQGHFSAPALFAVLLALGAVLAACSYRAPRLLRAPAALGTAAVVCALLLLSLDLLFHLPTPRAVRPWLLAGLLVTAGGLAWRRVRAPSALTGLLAAVVLLLVGGAVVRAGVIYYEVRVGMILLQTAAGVGFLLVAAMLCLDLRAPDGMGRAFWPRLGLLFLTGTLLRVGAVVASPDPIIDVYSWMQNAPRHVLRGENPYAVEYPNPYAADRAVRYGLMTEAEAAAQPRQRVYATYPPLPVLLTLPCAAAGLDVRYTNVAADLLAAAVLFLAAWRRRAPLIGALACALYLHLPRTPVMIENAFFEPMLAAALGGGLLLVERGNRLGRFVLGLGLAGKQFGLALLPALAATHRRQAGRLLAGCGLAAAVLVLPFFLWGPRAFLDCVVFLHLAGPSNSDTLTLGAAAHHLFGLDLPAAVPAAVAVVLIGWVSWRGREEGGGSALWLGASLLVFCLCFIKGYFHYFYLCEYLLLFGSASLAASAASAGADGRLAPAGRDAPAARAA